MLVSLLNVIYTLAALWLSVYAFHAFATILLYLKNRRDEPPPEPLDEWPLTLIQLPIYNERHVIERLVRSVAEIRYPRERLLVQILDDSTDDTTQLAEALVDRYRRAGLRIELFHRTARDGFKAGALREGLAAKPEADFVAIFDADFVPNPDFLRKTLPYFHQQSDLGLVQTRWGHLNAEESPFTMAQSVALDGHFVVEQPARSWAGLFVGFNGSGGVWRRRTIDCAGNWHSDTLTEDLDLSYRAQLLGWKSRFIPILGAQAEIPPTVMAFRRQQYRWAKGATQCARKLWRRVVTARMPLFKRIQGLLHMTSYLAHPLMLIVILSIVPLMIARATFFPILSVLWVGTFSYPLLYVLAQKVQYDDWFLRSRHLVTLTLLGVGIAPIVSKGVLEGLGGSPGEFVRTPKFGDDGAGRRARSGYGLRLDWLIFVEAFLALYSLGAVGVAILTAHYLALPFLVLYALGFIYVVVKQLREAATPVSAK